ncbi:MAG: DNA repair protein RadA [Neomegalonema sp.]|nr:DNA repair protein RadA [Neomegalonema sp.]
MGKAAPNFVCQECGAVYGKWAGRCDACGGWNTIAEEAGLSTSGPSSKSLGKAKGRAITLTPLSGQEAPPPRLRIGMDELDRVLGGGLVNGSAVLVGGDPGIGKSTLLLQAAARTAAQGGVLYVSGEEATAQIRMRASRLGLDQAPVQLASATNLRDILTTLEAERPRLAIIDSIQTMWSDHVESAPGSVAQVRACAHELVNFAKRRDVAVIIVGHVTKEGQIAGPRVMEHMVDTVLYFEGERGHQFRILRAVKNRFGAADEIGVFEMTGAGLAEVSNPSALFLGERGGSVTGSSVFAGLEGTRPVLVEIQALVAPSPLGTPRRAVVGWDSGRLAMVLAVLEARCGISLAGLDVYLNVAGGLRITEPAADLAVAAALLSAHLERPLPGETVCFGEISLSGAVRPVSQTEARLRESAKLGFAEALLPPHKAAQASASGGVDALQQDPARASGDRADEAGALDAPDGPGGETRAVAETGMKIHVVETLAAMVDRFRE